MTSKDILESLNYLEDDIIESAAKETSAKTKRRRNFRKWSVAAAMITVCIVGGTMMEAYGLTAKLGKFFFDDETSEYELKVYPIEEFTGEVREVENIIKKQIEEYSVYSSQAPESWFRYFDSSKEAMDYLGFEPMKIPAWEFEEQSVVLTILGNEDGKILSVSMEIDYEVDGIRMQSFSDVYTEHSKAEGIRVSSGVYEYLVWLLDAKVENIIVDTGEEIVEASSKYVYVTKNMKQGLVLKFNELQSGYASMEGYLVEGGVIYHMHVIYQEGGEERAEGLLYQWFEQF